MNQLEIKKVIGREILDSRGIFKKCQVQQNIVDS